MGVIADSKPLLRKGALLVLVFGEGSVLVFSFLVLFFIKFIFVTVLSLCTEYRLFSYHGFKYRIVKIVSVLYMRIGGDINKVT